MDRLVRRLRAIWRCAIVFLSIAAVGQAAAKLPDTTDLWELQQRVHQMGLRAGPPRESDAWLLAGLGRALLLENAYAAAEVEFGAAMTRADRLQRPQLKRQIELTRWQLIAAWQIRHGQPAQALQHLLALPTNADAAPSPPLARAIRAAACAELRDASCLRSAWVQLSATKGDEPLWVEEIHVLYRLATVLDEAGLTERGAAILGLVARFEPQDDDRLLALSDALRMFNEARLAAPDLFYENELDRIAASWLSPRDGAGKPQALRKSRLGFDRPARLLMLALLNRGQAALFANERDVAVTALANFDRVMAIQRPSSDADHRAIEELQRRRWILEARILAGGGHRAAAHHLLQLSDGRRLHTRADVFRLITLGLVYRRADMRPIFQAHIEALSALPRSGLNRGQQRLLAAWHAETGDLPAAWGLLWSLVEGPLKFAREANLPDLFVIEDVAYLAFAALRWQDPQAVASAARAVDEALSIDPPDSRLLALKSGLAAAAHGDEALRNWADGLATDSRMHESWRSRIAAEVAESNWVASATPARAIGWLSAAGRHEPSLALQLGLRALTIAQSSPPAARGPLVASALEQLRDALQKPATPLEAFLADATAARAGDQSAATVCDLRRRHAALGLPMQALVILPTLGEPASAGESAACSAASPARLAAARSAMNPDPAMPAASNGKWLADRTREIVRLWPDDPAAAALLAREYMMRIDGLAGSDPEAGRVARRLALDELDSEGRSYSPAALLIARHAIDVDPASDTEALAEVERLAAARAIGLPVLTGMEATSDARRGPTLYANRRDPSPAAPRLDNPRTSVVAAGPAASSAARPSDPSAVAADAGPTPPSAKAEDSRLGFSAASLSDVLLADELAHMARVVVLLDRATSPRSGPPVVVVECKHLALPRHDTLRQEGLARLNSARPDAAVAYRVSQLELFCGKRAVSDRAFQSALAAPESSVRSKHEHMVWRAADLANHGDLIGAGNAAAAWAHALDTALAQKRRPLKEDDVKSMMEELAATGVALTEEPQKAVRRHVCPLRKIECATMLLPGLRLRAELAQAEGGLPAFLAFMKSLAGDDHTVVAAHGLMRERLVRHGPRRTDESDQLLSAYRALPGLPPDVLADLPRPFATAITMACLRDVDATLAVASGIHRTAMSRYSPPPDALLQSAAGLEIVRRALSQRVPDAIHRWRRAGLPLLDESELHRAGLVAAGRALFRAGRPADAMAWLEARSSALRQVRVADDDLTDLFRAVAQHLLSLPVDQVKPSSLRVLEALNARQAHIPDTAFQRALGGPMPLLMAHAARSRGDAASALKTLLDLHAQAADRQATGANASAHLTSSVDHQALVARSTPFDSFARYAAEDLRAVVDRATAKRTYLGVVQPTGTVDRTSGPHLEGQLNETQRALLALLLVESGDRLGLSRSEREEMAFGIVQAATVGPTALDLLRALELAATHDVAVQQALVRYAAARDAATRDAATTSPDLASLAGGVDSASYTPPMADPCPPAEDAAQPPDAQQSALTRPPARSSRRHGHVISVAEAALWPPPPAPVTALAGVPTQHGKLPELEAFLRQSAARTLGPRVPVTLAEVRRRLCPSRALYFVTTYEAETYGFLITCQGIHANEVRSRQRALGAAALTKMIQDMRSQIAARADSRLLAADGTAAELNDALFGSWRTQLASVDEITIVARGPLEEMPFGALAAPRSASDAARTWFGARFAWSFGLVGARAEDPPVDPRAFAAKPVVQIGPPRFTDTDNCNDLSHAKGRPLIAAFCSLSMLEPLGASVSANLPGLAKPPAVHMALHEDFTRERLQAWSVDQTMRNAGVLIVATHGLLASQAQMLGGKLEPSLLVSGGPQGAELFTATDIAGLSAGADEIVLASCHTAAGWGDGVAERGFSGLVRAFLRAGGRNVIAALYDVNAGTTRSLLDGYFAQRAIGLSPPRALQAVVRDFGTKGGLLKSPWAWAGMVHVGPY